MSVVRRCPLTTVRYIEIALLGFYMKPFLKKCPLKVGVHCRGCPLPRGFTVITFQLVKSMPSGYRFYFHQLK